MAVEKGYNVFEAAELLGVKPRTVRGWCTNGTIKAGKIPGTDRWIIMETEIKRMQGANNDEATVN